MLRWELCLCSVVLVDERELVLVRITVPSSANEENDFICSFLVYFVI
jgi:hypothetical protein